MDWETQRQVVREQRAGYDWLAKMRLEEARRATFEDRVAAFRQILQLADAFQMRMPGREDDEQVTQRWSRIRARYDAISR